MALREMGYESEVCCIHYNITLYMLFLHKIIYELGHIPHI